MKLVSFSRNSQEHLGLLVEGKIYDLAGAESSLPKSLMGFLELGEEGMKGAREIEEAIVKGRAGLDPVAIAKKALLPPLSQPPTFRDGYAFRQHVEAGRRNRGKPMIPEYDEFPVFYFSNPRAMVGPNQDILCMPDHFDKLDFELEAAIVIGKKGRNIQAADADSYIAGYMILNDISARGLQMKEMQLNLGPAKGKDFATVIGPWLVTLDELESSTVSPPKGHVGTLYDLKMQCWVNGELLSSGNLKEMTWTFAEIIERASYGVDLYPGDVIGSGTVGTGCFLELNGTGKLKDKNYQERWLQPGDVVEMEITGLGKQKNVIREAE